MPSEFSLVPQWSSQMIVQTKYLSVNCSSKHEKESQHVEKVITYQYYCNYCYLASGKKFKHSKTKCDRLRIRILL